MLSTIGERIADARKRVGMSQAKLAEMLHVTQQCVGKWERGESLPDIHMLGRIGEILGTDAPFDIGCCVVSMPK